MSGICEGRVAIVTGAGRGIGRGHALELAAAGRAGRRERSRRRGRRHRRRPRAGAGRRRRDPRRWAATAIANGDDVSSWDGAEALVASAIETFGRLDVLVNNAGILRDRMLVNMTEEEWDAVIRVHLKGTFAPTHFAAAYWRERSKAGDAVDAARDQHVVDVGTVRATRARRTTARRSRGSRRFSIIAAKELGRYGVTVNAIAPGALTRMTENLSAGTRGAAERRMVRAVAREHRAPRHVARERGVGRRHRPGVPRRRRSHRGREGSGNAGPGVDRGARWDPSELGAGRTKLLAEMRGADRGVTVRLTQEHSMTVERFPIEAGHVMMFARSIGDPNPIYSDAEYAAASEVGAIIAPPTFVQASAQFDDDYPLRPKIGAAVVRLGSHADAAAA